jgi:predicted  nucleic acid-binding Zn-ribbon protein
MDHIEQRVIRLELQVEDHAEELKKLQDISNDLRKSLSSIEKTLAQIKWLATGAVIAIVGQAMGIEKVLKLFI